ncbi:MAG: hypothetical protein JST22_03075 [Bacteroidetes bacterium]|nr:hypothetical protein [Bacteroidota bacterium]
MKLLLEGDEPAIATLRQQLDACRVESRELTGAGFYVKFAVPNFAPRISGNKSFNFGDVSADIDGLASGAGFVLFVKDGALDMLEGYSYDEPWPTEIKNFRLSYTTGIARDWQSLRKKWS